MYAFYFLTVLYQGIDARKAAGSFRETSLARILKHFLLNMKAQRLYTLYIELYEDLDFRQLQENFIKEVNEMTEKKNYIPVLLEIYL